MPIGVDDFGCFGRDLDPTFPCAEAWDCICFLPESSGAFLLRRDEALGAEQLGGGQVAVAVGEGATCDEAAYELV